MDDSLFNPRFFAQCDLAQYVDASVEQSLLDRYRAETANAGEVMLHNMRTGMEWDAALQQYYQDTAEAFRRWREDHRVVWDMAHTAQEKAKQVRRLAARETVYEDPMLAKDAA